MSDAELHFAGLEMLLAAVHADDPKREILVRIGDAMREARAIIKRDEWRPIKAAPKDENVLLGWWCQAPGYQDRWIQEVGRADSTRGGWPHPLATHWQPLPAPPPRSPAATPPLSSDILGGASK